MGKLVDNIAQKEVLNEAEEEEDEDEENGYGNGSKAPNSGRKGLY
jgi:hypothetical protein